MMKRSTAKLLLLALLVLTMVPALTACSKESGSGDTHEITYWIAKGEDASLYSEYEDNPVIQYITQNYEFNGKKISFDFFVAPPGSESDDFNNLMGTGDYCDVMSMGMSGMSPADMLDEGMLWDLTELVPEHMPNLMAWLEENPDQKEYLYTYVDSEPRILNLTGFADQAEPNFQGFCYRRDWLVKYGTNPTTGAAFTGGFADANDPESWTDDVVFPSGGDEPIYISDWEWMFDIFVKAMADQGITDGYCYAPYYVGYMQTGDLYNGFGGGAPYWYYDGEKIVNGITNDNMRAYLQCLNTWYKNGWLDPGFDENTGDMFFSVDSASVFQGKVGLWQGRQSTVGAQIDSGEGFTQGAMVYGCRQPINDVYGGPDQQGHEPDHLYQNSRHNNDTIILTDKMTEEEVIAFLEFVDFLYTDEGALLCTVGLNAEQLAATPSKFYESQGLTEGSYTVEEVNGERVLHPKLNPAETVFNAARLERVATRFVLESQLDRGYDRYIAQAVESWDYYTKSAEMPVRVTSSVTPAQNQEIARIRSSLEQFQQRVIPAAIKGEGYDVWSDAGWESFCKDINKYRAEEITAIYQSILDSFN